MSSYTPNLQLFKYNTSTDGKEVFSIEQALNHNWDILDQNSGSRNIGEIVASTIPLTDAGLHLLDGSLLQYGSYKAFIDYIAGLVSSYPDLFVSESDWQDSITSYGVCGKFVYDSENNTVRLPKITGIIEGTTDISALLDLVAAGLPNITGSIPISEYCVTGHVVGGAFYQGAYINNKGEWGDDWGDNYTVHFNASRSSSIYGNSSTVQPQTIKVLYYIVIAGSAKTNIQVDIDQIATDLNGKVDKSDLQECHIVVEAYQSGYSWYRVYSDGWCEQGGGNIGSSGNVYFSKPFRDTTYCLVASIGQANYWDTYEHYNVVKQTTEYFSHNCCLDGYWLQSWYACGYIGV